MTMRNLVFATGLSFALLAGCQSNEGSSTDTAENSQNQEQANGDVNGAEGNGAGANENSDQNSNQNEEQNKSSEDDQEKKDANKDEPKEESAYPTMTETVTETEGELTVTNPDSIFVVANKERNLPSDFVPDNLVEPDVAFYAPEGDPKRLMVQEAATALEKMFAGAKEAGYELKAVSGYRSYDRQETIFAYNADRYGKEKANQVSAQAGQSEHQTGLTMDISTPSIGSALTEEFGSTPEGQWVAENAYKYGFVVRYLKGKEDITGYQYEPWHVRYVGRDAGKAIHEAGITLEEFFEAGNR
ncbi:D-alanyl-D-alanine carboxypeptidase family protein [Pseudalkalibacillus hwajinpoensis]|uniref:M15 family metallopeptidase n=1 Tax=Guptibacillus hwajinpoensis TaxID=208199 RepID=UPI00325BC95E